MKIYGKRTEEIKSSLLRLTSLTLVALFAVVLLMVFIITYILKINSGRENIRYKLDFAYYQVNNEFNNMLNSAVNITGSQLVADLLSHEGEYPISEMMEDYNLIAKFIGGFVDSAEANGRSYSIYVNNPTYIEGRYVLDVKRLEGQGIYNKIEELYPYEVLWHWDRDDAQIKLFKKICSSKELGILEVSIPEKKLLGILNEISFDSSEGIAVSNNDSDIIVLCGQYMPKDSLRVKKTLSNDMSIIVSRKMSEIIKSVIFIFLVLSIPIGLLLAIILQTYKHLLTKITDRLYSFIHKLQEENGENISVECEDEIGFIEAKFRDVYNKNRELYENIEKINKEKNKMEIKFLQYSLNPHLLYNSLSVIKWLLIDMGKNEVTDVIDNMVSYYRLVLSEGQEIIPIRQEIELLTKYIGIIEMTYRYKIDLNIHIDDNILDNYIIKMILQPFVENAVMHGLVGRENPRLDISCNGEDDRFIFEITDNGNGIDEKTLKNIQNDNFKRHKRGFGLKNSKKRIEMYYGSDCGFEIFSKEGEGTTAKIILKKINQNTDG